jgi:Dolichyl-phosphate-mannose-protein mannosyltransferase
MRKNAFALAALAAALAALRFILILHYGFDSDEPQHMHVAWAWAHGLVQYRDVFDNHMPLFHLLASPLFLWRGEDVHLLFLARFAVVPLFVVSAVLVWRISRILHDVRTAWWTTAMVALFAPFFLGTLEFRTDDLWVVFWLAAIAAAIGSRPLDQRSWRAALLIGFAFAVSLKSTLFIIALGGATVVTYALTARAALLPARRTIRIGGVSAAMIALPPAAVAAAFAAAGAWQPFKYGVFLHNVFPHERDWRMVWLIPAFFITRAGVRHLLQSIRTTDDASVALGRRRLFVFLACMIFGGVLSGLWPMLSLESYLPFYPLAFIVSVPLILESSAILGRRNVLAKACIAVELVALLAISQPWKDNTPEEIDLVADVLSITGPGDPVMDLKGETLFRVRPYFLVIESITNRKFRLGRIADDIADTLVRSSTHVVATDRLPQRSRRFVHENYLPWGHVRVAGFRLLPFERDECVRVRVEVSGQYVLLGDTGPVEASVDGSVYEKSVFLRVGEHMLASRAIAQRPLLVWSGALRSARAAVYRLQAIRDGEDPHRRARMVMQDLVSVPEPQMPAAGS